jgi:hypothetical protein
MIGMEKSGHGRGLPAKRLGQAFFRFSGLFQPLDDLIQVHGSHVF